MAHIPETMPHMIWWKVFQVNVLDVLQFCRDQPESVNNDSTWDGARVVGHTSEYSGTYTSGNLLMGTNRPILLQIISSCVALMNPQTMMCLYWHFRIILEIAIGGETLGVETIKMEQCGLFGMVIIIIQARSILVMGLLKDMLVINCTAQPIVVHMRYSFDRLFHHNSFVTIVCV